MLYGRCTARKLAYRKLKISSGNPDKSQADEWEGRVGKGSRRKKQRRGDSLIERMGLISIHVRASSLPRTVHAFISPPSSFPSFSLPGLPGGTTLCPLVRVPPVLSANRPGCHSARDAMPEVAAGSSRKSFLERARSKLLRWLRRSLRTTHQVIKTDHLAPPFTKYCPVILITSRTLSRQFPGEARSLCATLAVSCSGRIYLQSRLFNEVQEEFVLCHAKLLRKLPQSVESRCGI